MARADRYDAKKKGGATPSATEEPGFKDTPGSEPNPEGSTLEKVFERHKAERADAHKRIMRELDDMTTRHYEEIGAMGQPVSDTTTKKGD